MTQENVNAGGSSSRCALRQALPSLSAEPRMCCAPTRALGSEFARAACWVPNLHAGIRQEVLSEMAVSEPHRHREASDVADCSAQPATQPIGTTTRRTAAKRGWPAPRAGSLLGDRYELGEVIGRGGMSTVHRAYDLRAGTHVAVKVFRPGTDLLDADARHRREVELLSALSNPGLVAVLDAEVGETATLSGIHYLVTELVDGPTLSQRIRNSPLTEQQVARLGASLSRRGLFQKKAAISRSRLR